MIKLKRYKKFDLFIVRKTCLTETVINIFDMVGPRDVLFDNIKDEYDVKVYLSSDKTEQILNLLESVGIHCVET